MAAPAVTVIIPRRNSGRFLARTLGSFLAQSWQWFEVLLDPIPWRALSEVNPVEDPIHNRERDLHIPAVCLLFRAAHLAGLTFSERLPDHAEWDDYLQRLLRGGRLHVTTAPLVSYRRHPGSLSTQHHAMAIGRRYVLERLAQRPDATGADAQQRLAHEPPSAGQFAPTG